MEELEPVIIEDVQLMPLTQAELWLAQAEAEVAEQAKLYGSIEIKSKADYIEVKQARAQLNKDIEAFEQQRKDKTREVERLVKEFKQSAATVLAPLTAKRLEYTEQLNSWDDKWLQQRKATLKEQYQELGGVLDDGLAPFERIWDTYSKDKKWANKTVSQEKCYQDLARIVERMSEDYTTIGNLDMTDEERTQVRAEYLETLNFPLAIKNVQARREQQQRVRELEAAKSGAESDSKPVEQQGALSVQQEDKPVLEPVTEPISTWQIVLNETTFEATKTDAVKLAEAFKAVGVSGKITRSN